MTHPILKLENIGKHFPIYQEHHTLYRLSRSFAQGLALKQALWALRHINLEVKKGEKIAIIGLNGAGKTTLFRIASGIYAPTEGRVYSQERLVPFFSYHVGMNPLLSVLDNIYIMAAFYGIVVKEICEKIQDILDFSELEVFAQTPVRFLSTGQMLRLTFSVFAQTRDRFLAFDENPGFGDLRFEQKARQYFNQLIADPEKTILMASHALDLLPNYCRRALWLHEGQLRMDGPVPEVLKAYRDFCQLPATPLPLKEFTG